jgi:hypothetical protein
MGYFEFCVRHKSVASSMRCWLVSVDEEKLGKITKTKSNRQQQAGKEVTPCMGSKSTVLAAKS